MSVLLRGNLRQIGVEIDIESCFGEVGLCEIGETFAVECILEVFKIKTELKDVDVAECSKAGVDRCRPRVVSEWA